MAILHFHALYMARSARFTSPDREPLGGAVGVANWTPTATHFDTLTPILVLGGGGSLCERRDRTPASLSGFAQASPHQRDRSPRQVHSGETHWVANARHRGESQLHTLADRRRRAEVSHRTRHAQRSCLIRAGLPPAYSLRGSVSGQTVLGERPNLPIQWLRQHDFFGRPPPALSHRAAVFRGFNLHAAPHIGRQQRDRL